MSFQQLGGRSSAISAFEVFFWGGGEATNPAPDSLTFDCQNLAAFGARSAMLCLCACKTKHMAICDRYFYVYAYVYKYICARACVCLSFLFTQQGISSERVRARLPSAMGVLRDATPLIGIKGRVRGPGHCSPKGRDQGRRICAYTFGLRLLHRNT